MCKRQIHPIRALLFLGAFACIDTRAEIPLDFHVSGQANYTRIKVSDEKFSSALFHLKGDLEFTGTSLDGIGLQGVIGIPMSDDEKYGMTLEVTEQSAAYITLTNPEYEPGDLKLSILLGYASTSIETNTAELPNNAGKREYTFSGFSFGFSLQDPILEGKPYYWTIDCARSFKDDDVSIDGCGLGVTYAF